ncbi:MAG: serine protease [Solirubrobacteraceae bacterium]|nr:serine protease [Solirubrobacteraceae bacterium]
MVAGEDERGREVRAGLLSPPAPSRRTSSAPSRPQLLLAAWLLLALASALAAAPARAASDPTTGRLLVTLKDGASARAAAAVTALAGVRRDGAQVPQIGLVSVRPTGLAPSAAAAALRSLPGVAHVEVEHRHELRLVPNDPSLTTPETAPGTPAGTPLQWWVARTNLPAAWDLERGAGATVAVIDSGVDAGQPELAGKIDQAIDFDDMPNHGPATGDENGHGTHVSSLACAAGDNGAGIVGAGLDCRLLVIKTDLADGSIARSIVKAADLGADAVNMSFGTNGASPAAEAIGEAVDYAVGKDVVLVAAAADKPVDEQGDPANLLQPTGSGSDIGAGRGLTVTAANFFDQRAPFAGRGSQISLAAYGSFDQTVGPAGLIGAFPGNSTELERGEGLLLDPEPPCDCRTQIGGDNRYAYLQGTSMAAPIVAAIAALARTLNPDLKAPEVIRVLKQTATRPAGTNWSPELGWGIVNAGAALSAVAAIDRHAPTSKLRGSKRVRRARAVTVTWTGRDKAPAKLRASGIAYYDVYRSTDRKAYKRIKRTSRTRLRVLAKAGTRYRFYTVGVDKAGNREAVPPRPDLTMHVDRRRR